MLYNLAKHQTMGEKKKTAYGADLSAGPHIIPVVEEPGDRQLKGSVFYLGLNTSTPLAHRKAGEVHDPEDERFEPTEE
jgi:hypothetical protein